MKKSTAKLRRRRKRNARKQEEGHLDNWENEALTLKNLELGGDASI